MVASWRNGNKKETLACGLFLILVTENGNFEFARGTLVKFVPNEPKQNDYQITYLLNAIELSY